MMNMVNNLMKFDLEQIGTDQYKILSVSDAHVALKHGQNHFRKEDMNRSSSESAANYHHQAKCHILLNKMAIYNAFAVHSQLAGWPKITETDLHSS